MESNSLPSVMTTGAVAIATRYELSVAEVVGQVRKIQEIMRSVMREGEHYGTIPGTNKPTLYKPGAETLAMVFRLRAEFDSDEIWDGQHLTVKSRCTLHHIPTGEVRGSGEGSCSTKESKYAYRNASRACTKCGVEAIIRGKEEYGGGWVCFRKKGGCGAKFATNAKEITEQQAGRAPNEDIADCYNTVLKMANKRSLVAATLIALAVSDIFTQDLDDLPPSDMPNPTTREPRAETPADRMREAGVRTRQAETRKAARQDPPRKAAADPEVMPPNEPPEAGFDADAPVGRDQQLFIWSACKRKAEETGEAATDILAAALSRFDCTKSDQLMMSQVDDVLGQIEAYGLDEATEA